MERKAIELGGIVRNLPDNTVKDGTFQELINLRPRDGALRPVGMKAYIEDDSYPTSVRYIHRINDSLVVYIGGVNPTFLTYWVWDEVASTITEHLTSQQMTPDMGFASWNNVLVISERVNEVMSMLLFDELTRTYVAYDGFGGLSLLPDLPDITFQRLAFPAGNDTKDINATAETVYDALLSQWVKVQSERGDAGFLTGCILVRCAWEMVDGTIIKQSMPDKVYCSELITEADFTESTPAVNTTFTAYKLQYRVNCDPTWLAGVKEQYKGIIKSLVIYITSPRSPELEKYEDVTIGRREYDVGTLHEYIPNIEQENYYFLKEYSLDSLEANTLTTIALESILDLNTRQQLPINNLSHHTIFGRRLFVYNSRIFLGDIKNYLFKYPVLQGLIGPGAGSVSGSTYRVHLEFDIAISNNKTVTVRSGFFDCDYHNPDGDIEFWIKYQELAAAPDSRREKARNDNSYWGYPDARARNARVLVSTNGGVSFQLAGTYTLTSIPSQNFSYHNGVKIKGSSFEPTIPAVSYLGVYYDHDRIQATEINNPFYYPAINSYRVQGKVLGLSTNAIALSSGQFGQFPVYAFTNEGIWTMSIGTGETLINSITPLSREVCNNPKSITPIDGGTAFVSGRGLFIISGNQVIEISDMAEGQQTSRLTGLATYNTLLSQPSLSGIAFMHCSVPFLEFLTDAILGFDYINSELLVSNNSKGYSWVYSLKAKMWFKISQSWDTFVNDYPTLYGYEDGRVARRHEINVEDFRSSVAYDLALVFGQTRPIKISGADFKKIHRVILGGNIQNDITPVVKFAVAVFGTTDNKTWMLLNNGRDFGTDDIMLLGRSQYSVRQIIIVFGGHVEADSYLNYITFDFEERYGGKLR